MSTVSLSPTARLLADLIRIPSVNPGGDPGTPHINEKKLGTFVAQFLKASGARVRVDTVEPNRPNVMGVFPCAKPVRRRVLFAPHLDTVSVKGMTIDPFRPVVRKGRMYGRGACDTKGSMAAMLVALSEYARSGRASESHTEFSFIAFMGEEEGFQGSKHFTKKAPRYDLALIGEPTDLRIVRANKTICCLEIETRGRACHCSTPERGVNAIGAMSDVIAFLHGDFLSKHLPPPEKKSGFEGSTASVSLIRGGVKANVVPDACTIAVDMRLAPPVTAAQAVRILKRELKQHHPSARVISAHVMPPFSADLSHPLLREILPHTKGFTVAPWACDASPLAQRGIPSVALGPGSIDQAHTKDEFISLKQLDSGTKMFCRILQTLS